MSMLLKEYGSLSQLELQECLYEACKKGELEKVKYLLTSPELMFHADINKHEGDALICAVNNLHYNVIEYLVQSPELKEHICIHTQYDFAIIQACENGDAEMVKYLLTSPNLKEHSDIHTKGRHFGKDRPFLMAYICERMEVLQYLICDYNIPKTDRISHIMNDDPKEITSAIENMFKFRELHKELNSELSLKNLDKKKNKI